MAQFFRYPAGSTVSISAIGTNGATAPTSSIEVGGIGDDGNLHGVHTDNNGNVYTVDAFPATAKHVIVDSSALPSGASTSALQTSGNASLTSIDGKTPTVGQKAMAASRPVVIASDQSSLPVTVGNFPATQPVSGTVAVTQATGTNLHAVIDSGSVTVTQATGTNLHTVVDSGTVAATQSGTWNINNVSGTVSLPTGAATETTLAAVNTKTPALGQAVMASSVPVVIASNQSTLSTNQAQINGVTQLAGNGVTGTGSQRVTIASDNTAFPTKISDGTNTATVKAASTAPVAGDSALVVTTSPNSPAPKAQAGRSLANAPIAPFSYDATAGGTNVTSAAYVQLIASTTSAASMIEVFDSSGVTLYLAVGAAASEVNQFVIFPGGNGQVPLAIPAGSRISIKATTTTASVGFISINLYT